MTVTTIILAAGEGKRMRSALPKVLHVIGDRPMLEHVVSAAQSLPSVPVYVVYGHGGAQVRGALPHLDVVWVEQDRQLGTGHAVAQAMPHVDDEALVLILYGDVPLISTETLTRLVATATAADLALLTAELDRPQGYGRIVRDAGGEVRAIVEDKDAGAAERSIREINTGMLAARAGHLRRWLGEINNDNAQGEYYLTDIVALAVREGASIATIQPDKPSEIMGVNDRAQLAALERDYQDQQAERLMLQGVTLRDPARFDLRGALDAGRDVVVDVDVVFEGRVRLGDGVRIGPFCVIRDSTIAEGVVVAAHCVIEAADVGAHARIGPYSRIRPETSLGAGVHIGNFVEIKKSEVGDGSKINHLSYVGDATIGREVNIGAGTITCNYDGAFKHRTEIGDQAFIGSDTQLVAPVKIGSGATIGAGSTITRDAPAHELTLSRAPQRTRAGWRRPRKDQGSKE